MILDDRYILIGNAEIYNHKELEAENGFIMKSGSDCEVLLHLFKKYGIDQLRI